MIIYMMGENVPADRLPEYLLHIPHINLGLPPTYGMLKNFSQAKELGQHMATHEREKYHSEFQFLWMDEVDTVNSIMMSFIERPFVMVLDPTVHLFYVPEITVGNLDAKTFGKFLDDVKAGKVKAMGGTGFLQRLKRIFYDILTTVIEVWESSRWLFLIMFGLPTAVISIVCYSICCMESVEDEIHSDDEESDEEYALLLQEQERLQKQLQAEEKAVEQKDSPRDPGHEKSE